MLWCATIATIARSHYIKEIVLKFLKRRFDDLATFLFEISIFQLIRTNSNRLSLLIHRSRVLSIFRSIIRKIRTFFYRELRLISWSRTQQNVFAIICFCCFDKNFQIIQFEIIFFLLKIEKQLQTFSLSNRLILKLRKKLNCLLNYS